MIIKAFILLALLSRTPHHLDTETWSEREERMELVADSIMIAVDRATCHEQPEGPCKSIWDDSAYGRKSLAVLLVIQANHETNLSHRIHDNQCRLQFGECDARKDFNPKTQKYVLSQQSYSLWQVKKFRDIPLSHWRMIEKGREGTHYAAWHAARRLISGYWACGSSVQGAIARYAVGSGCEWEPSKDRFNSWKALMNASPDALRKVRERHRSALEEQLIASMD